MTAMMPIAANAGRAVLSPGASMTTNAAPPT